MFVKGLFCDIRQLLNYIKETHGGTFRRIALSGLMDALKPLATKEKESTKKIIRHYILLIIYKYNNIACLILLASDFNTTAFTHTAPNEFLNI